MAKQTILQRLGRRQKLARLLNIHECYQSRSGCTINYAVTFIPESQAIVQEYSKLRTQMLSNITQGEITYKDIVEYVYGADTKISA